VNGAGKTTLLRILAGEIEASGGEHQYGSNTKVAYYAQHHAEVLRKEWDVYTTVKAEAEDASHQQVRAALGALLFGDQEIEKKIGVLSGGERARVALACMLVRPGNVLLMDEPTNHLDLESSERLAEALAGFDGTLLFVSHNRAFIRRLATSLWFVEDGMVVVYPGTLDKREARHEPKSPAPSREEDKARRRQEADRRKELNKKLRPLQRRAEELEKTVARLEKEQAEREAQMSDPATYGDAKRQSELTQAYARAKVELEVAMDTWAEVQEELELIERG
jgi:ATP-binding cassette subfamily F protein 3